MLSNSPLVDTLLDLVVHIIPLLPDLTTPEIDDGIGKVTNSFDVLLDVFILGFLIADIIKLTRFDHPSANLIITCPT